MTKKVLITGKNSYIGTSFIKYCQDKNYDLIIDEVSSRDNNWKEVNFEEYDVVFHVAGIAHQNRKDVSDDVYYKINCDLAVEVANYAKDNNVKQFIFMSSMIVYGASSKIGEPKIITQSTNESPINSYGNSKLQADKQLQHLNSDTFKVTSIRPPMVYGPNSKGNFNLLLKFAKILPIFPHVNNQRSMIYIENLCEFIYTVIEYNLFGIYFPQNESYVTTSEMFKLIALNYNKKVFLTNIFNPLLKIMGNRFNIVNKVFGNLAYDYEISSFNYKYNKVNFEDSISKSLRDL